MSSFSDFGFHPEIQNGLEAMGFKTPTPVQDQAIPPIMEGRDAIVCAQTGTGKTAAYVLPLMHGLMTNARDHSVGALIISPTRELAVQIDQNLEGLSYFTGMSSIAIYGGGDGIDFEQERRALNQGADIIVGTPGRLMSHLNLGYVKLQSLRYLVLDEADRMLDMGFHEDIMKIVSFLPKERQTMLFSATMPSRIRELSGKLLKDPIEVNIAISKPAAGVLQGVYEVPDGKKVPLVVHLLKDKDYPSIIVFSSTKANVKRLSRELIGKGLRAAAIHSDLNQQQREEVLLDFRNRKIQILVATDIVSRGIDIDNINLVMNYDVPNDAEDYIHRIGRTARASSTGVALTLLSDDRKEQRKFMDIERLIERRVNRVPLPADL